MTHIEEKLFKFFQSKYQNLQLDEIVYNRLQRKQNLINRKILMSLIIENKQTHITLKKLRELYYGIDPSTTFSLETLKRFINSKLQITYRRPIIKTTRASSDSNFNTRAIFLKKVIKLIQEECCLIFIDETSFQNRKRIYKKWLRKDEKECNIDNGRLKSQNMIIAVTMAKVIFYQIYEKSTNSDKIIEFFNQLLMVIKHQGDYEALFEEGRVWFVLDNASYHTSRATRNFFWDKNINILFTAPYCPTLNMAEFVFAILKNRFYCESFEKKYHIIV